MSNLSSTRLSNINIDESTTASNKKVFSKFAGYLKKSYSPEEIEQLRIFSDNNKRLGELEANKNLLKMQHDFRQNHLGMSQSDIDKYSLDAYNKTYEVYKKNKLLIDSLFSSNAYLYSRGAYIFGPTGIGKSHILKTFAICQVNQKNKTLFVDYIKTMESLLTNQKRFGLEEKYYRDMHKLKNTDVLIIDQFNNFLIESSHSKILHELLNYRYENNKRTYFSSDVNPNDLKNKFDVTLISIIEGLANPIRLKGETDLRRLA